MGIIMGMYIGGDYGDNYYGYDNDNGLAIIGIIWYNRYNMVIECYMDKGNHPLLWP